MCILKEQEMYMKTVQQRIQTVDHNVLCVTLGCVLLLPWQLRGSYVLTPQVLTRAKEKMVILHPLPRVDEIRWDFNITLYLFTSFKINANCLICGVYSECVFLICMALV